MTHHTIRYITQYIFILRKSLLCTRDTYISLLQISTYYYSPRIWHGEQLRGASAAAPNASIDGENHGSFNAPNDTPDTTLAPLPLAMKSPI